MILNPDRIAQARTLVSQRLDQPAWSVMIQVFIGLGWLRAATEKIIDPRWWTGETLSLFLADHSGAGVGWYEPLINLAVDPQLVMVALTVIALQIVAGVTLLTGRHLSVGLAVGMFMNVHFVAAGAVNPSAFYLLAQGAVALWLAEQGRARALQRLQAMAGAGVFLALLSVPFIRTIHPAEVIDDPAIMLVTGGLLAAMCCEIAHQRCRSTGKIYSPV